MPTALRRVAELTLSYAEPRESFTKPNIYVSLRTGRVTAAYIKKDDYGICCMDDLSKSLYYTIGSRKVLHDLIGR